jgi:hypothetical protein
MTKGVAGLSKPPEKKAGVVATAIELPEEVGAGGDVDDLHRLHGPRLGQVLSEFY